MGLNGTTKQKEMQLFVYNNEVGLFSLLETKIKRAKAHGTALNLCNEERIGSPVRLVEIRESRKCVDVFDLKDLKSLAAFNMWTNKQGGNDRVLCKLDRVLINCERKTDLPASQVHFMNEGLFDHCPAVMNWDDGIQVRKKVLPRDRRGAHLQTSSYSLRASMQAKKRRGFGNN
ncbi:hypothetical protein HAX54_031121 [Datura stramonium]|uniref:Uncharacterized protein n=1 Tax=Datura stramonium TaxID=4076 RepID=A0ABS8VBI5_DATST|nr:hypothetical protein [Datura stramonium]